MGSGKTMVARALANECDAMVLDISPTNLEGNYHIINRQIYG